MENGTKQVGLNGVSVSVPDTWGSNAAPRSPSVVLFDASRAGAEARLGRLLPAGRVGGHQVLAGIAVAELSAPGRCSQGFGVPDLNAWFRVTVWSDQGGHEAIRTIRDSLTLGGEG